MLPGEAVAATLALLLCQHLQHRRCRPWLVHTACTHTCHYNDIRSTYDKGNYCTIVWLLRCDCNTHHQFKRVPVLTSAVLTSRRRRNERHKNIGVILESCQIESPFW